MIYHLQIIKTGLSLSGNVRNTERVAFEPGDVLEVDFSLNDPKVVGPKRAKIIKRNGGEYFHFDPVFDWFDGNVHWRLSCASIIKKGVAADITKNIAREKKLDDLGIK